MHSEKKCVSRIQRYPLRVFGILLVGVVMCALGVEHNEDLPVAVQW